MSGFVDKILAIKSELTIPQYYRYKGLFFPEDVESGGGKFSCQIHGPDTNPSAVYNPETQTMKCFACDLSGDIISIVMAVECLPSFRDTVDFILSHFTINMAASLFAETPASTYKSKYRKDLIKSFEDKLWKYIDKTEDYGILTTVSDAYLLKDNSELTTELTKIMGTMK